MNDGRLARRLTALLSAHNLSQIELYAVSGHYRTSKYADCCRWEGRAMRNGIKVCLSSWDTMTDCVRLGVVVSELPNYVTEGNNPSDLDVSAKGLK